MNESKVAEFRSQADMCAAKSEAAQMKLPNFFISSWEMTGSNWPASWNVDILEIGEDQRKWGASRQSCKPVTFPIEGPVLGRQHPKAFRFQDQAK